MSNEYRKDAPFSKLPDAAFQEGFRMIHDDKTGCQAFVCFISLSRIQGLSTYLPALERIRQ
jgi:hypothetical protein